MPSQRMGEGGSGQGFEPEGMLRGGDGNDGQQKDDVVGDAERGFARRADFAEDRARREAGGDDADGRQFEQREQQDQVAFEAARGGQHGQQADGTGSGRDRDQRPGAHEQAGDSAARRRAFAEQLDEVEERLHEGRADALLHQRDRFALDPEEEPRGGHGEEQSGKDEQARECGECQIHGCTSLRRWRWQR
jgi:hypothetical protein